MALDEMMKQHKPSALLKALAKEQLMGKYGNAIAIFLVYIGMIYGCSGIASIFSFLPGVIGTLLYYGVLLFCSIFSGFFAYGVNLAFLKTACGTPAKVSDIFAGFKANSKEIMKAQAYKCLLTFLGMTPCYIFLEVVDLNKYPDLFGVYMLLIALGMVIETLVTLVYNQVFFIMLDFPNYNAKKALAFSRELMKGNKGRYLYFLLSFLPLIILGLMTCCVGLLWIMPYMQTAMAFFYLDLMQNKN